jgi:hypothetical protein
MDTAKLIAEMFAARNKFLAAAAALDAAISSLDAAAPATVVKTISGDIAPGQLFQTPHGDPA